MAAFGDVREVDGFYGRAAGANHAVARPPARMPTARAMANDRAGGAQMPVSTPRPSPTTEVQRQPDAPAAASHRRPYGTPQGGDVWQTQRTTTAPDREPERAEASNQNMGSGRDAGEQKYHSVHVYGGKAALCFSADETRADKEQTVRLEAATALGGRRYDWGQKVALQFTSRELPQVLAVFMGWIPQLKLSAHGPANDKWASFANQAGGKVYVTIGQSKNSKAVPIMAGDIYQIVDLLIKQLLKNSPHMGAEGLLMMVRSLAERYRQEQPTAAPPAA